MDPQFDTTEKWTGENNHLGHPNNPNNPNNPYNNPYINPNNLTRSCADYVMCNPDNPVYICVCVCVCVLHVCS